MQVQQKQKILYDSQLKEKPVQNMFLMKNLILNMNLYIIQNMYQEKKNQSIITKLNILRNIFHKSFKINILIIYHKRDIKKGQSIYLRYIKINIQNTCHKRDIKKESSIKLLKSKQFTPLSQNKQYKHQLYKLLSHMCNLKYYLVVRYIHNPMYTNNLQYIHHKFLTHNHSINQYHITQQA